MNIKNISGWAMLIIAATVIVGATVYQLGVINATLVLMFAIILTAIIVFGVMWAFDR